MAVACLAGTALVASAAQAGTPGTTVSLGKSKGLLYYKATYQDVVTQTAQPVQCGDADVTGGGGSIAGPAESSALHESYPIDGTGWQVEGSSTDGARKMTGFAICDPDEQYGYYDTQSSLPENGAVVHGAANCGGSSQPIGGGAGATGGGIRLIASRPAVLPSTPGWRPSATNPTENDTLFNAYAICGSKADTDSYRFRESEPTRLRAGDAGKATAKCKPDEAVMGGGFIGELDNVSGYGVLAKSLRPVDSGDRKKTPDDGWQAAAVNSESFKVNLIALAVCRRP